MLSIPKPTSTAYLSIISRELFAFLLLLAFVLALFSPASTNDLTIYFQAALACDLGQNPYEVFATTMYPQVGEVRWYYLYPPLLVTALTLVVPYGGTAVFLLWGVITSLSLVLSASTICALLKRSSIVSFTSILVALTVFPITLDSISRGQINTWILALLLGTAYGVEKKSWRLVGWMIALATHLKLSPILLVLLFFHPVVRPALKHFCIALLVISIPITALGGFDIWSMFYESLSETASGSRIWISPENLSLSRLVSFVWPALDNGTALKIQYGLSALMLVMIGVSQSYRSNPTRILMGLVLVLLMTSPLLWYGHLLWALPPILFIYMNGGLAIRSSVILITGIATFYRYAELGYCLNKVCTGGEMFIEPTIAGVFLIGLFGMIRQVKGCS